MDFTQTVNIHSRFSMYREEKDYNILTILQSLQYYNHYNILTHIYGI